MFLSIDGIDGCGKSTQIGLLEPWLAGRGHAVVVCRDPGSTPLGERIRKVLLHCHDLNIDRRSEMFLYMAARSQMVEEVIRPALAAGKTVLADRFLLANVVYQGYAVGLDVATLWEIGRVAVGGLMPELTIVLDLPADEAEKRLRGPRDRMEKQGADFYARVRQGFLTEAERPPQTLRVVDARRSPAEVQEELRRIVVGFGG